MDSGSRMFYYYLSISGFCFGRSLWGGHCCCWMCASISSITLNLEEFLPNSFHLRLELILNVTENKKK